MPLAGFEPATPASGRPQTLAFDLSATWIGKFDLRTVQSVASRYTDWAIPANGMNVGYNKTNSVCDPLLYWRIRRITFQSSKWWEVSPACVERL